MNYTRNKGTVNSGYEVHFPLSKGEWRGICSVDNSVCAWKVCAFRELNMHDHFSGGIKAEVNKKKGLE